jgi:putative flippase GtrA
MLKKIRDTVSLRDLMQFIKFGLVGVSNTLISLAVYYICLHLLHFAPQICNLFGFIISVINAYIWNLRWVFKTSGSKGRLLRFFCSYLFTYLLSVALLYVWINVLLVNESIAPLISLVVTVPTNYLLNRFWTFKK